MSSVEERLNAFLERQKDALANFETQQGYRREAFIKRQETMLREQMEIFASEAEAEAERQRLDAHVGTLITLVTERLESLRTEASKVPHAQADRLMQLGADIETCRYTLARLRGASTIADKQGAIEEATNLVVSF